MIHEYLKKHYILVILSKENPLFKDFCKCAKTCKNQKKKKIKLIFKKCNIKLVFKSVQKLAEITFFKLKQFLGIFIRVDPITILTATYRSNKLFWLI